MSATIVDSQINLEGFRYFVGKASDVTFGAWGDKKTPIGPGTPGYLDVDDVIPASKLAEVKLAVTPLTVAFADRAGIDFFAGVMVPGWATGGGLTLDDFSGGQVKLVKVAPQDERELVRQINASPSILARLIDLGGGARVVNSILIAVEARLFDRFVASLTSQGAALVEGRLARAERSGAWEGGTVIELGPGTTVAYSLAAPKWNAYQDQNKTAVIDLRDDRQGL